MAKKIVVDDVEYQEVDVSGERLMIVCVDNRGLTFVGKCDLSKGEDLITIRDARCIVYWGTTKHIGELVGGPTDKTRLGFQHDVIVGRKNIVFAYDCNEEAWNG